MGWNHQLISKWLESPPFVSHEGTANLEGENHNPHKKGTYDHHTVMILQVHPRKFNGAPKRSSNL